MSLLVHRVEKREMPLLDLLELFVGVVVGPWAATQKHEAEGVYVHASLPGYGYVRLVQRDRAIPRQQSARDAAAEASMHGQQANAELAERADIGARPQLARHPHGLLRGHRGVARRALAWRLHGVVQVDTRLLPVRGVDGQVEHAPERCIA